MNKYSESNLSNRGSVPLASNEILVKARAHIGPAICVRNIVHIKVQLCIYIYIYVIIYIHLCNNVESGD